MKLDKTKITADDGGVKISLSSGQDLKTSFINAGIGFHTIYAPSGVTSVPVTNGEFTCYGHLTGKGSTTETNGWLFAIQTNGNVYASYLIAGTWSDWKQLNENDSGWINLTLNTGISEYSNVWTPKYRKIGNVVYIRGAVKGITNNNKVIAALPIGFRPSDFIHFTQVATTTGGNAYSTSYRITNKGQIVMEVTGEGSTPSATDLFPIDTVFPID